LALQKEHGAVPDVIRKALICRTIDARCALIFRSGSQPGTLRQALKALADRARAV
jgi:hypothetical protein